MAAKKLTLEDWKLEDIKRIKYIYPELAGLTDNEINSLYKQYSHETSSAHDWRETTAAAVRDFAEWALTSPVDMIKEGRKYASQKANS